MASGESETVSLGIRKLISIPMFGNKKVNFHSDVCSVFSYLTNISCLVNSRQCQDKVCMAMMTIHSKFGYIAHCGQQLA